MIRYGIISAAKIIPRFVAGVKESKDGEVVAIAAREYARAQEMAEKLEIPNVYGSYQELLQDATIDIVYIAVYNKGHYETAKEALLANKHVLLEKPFTLNWDEAEELFDLARERQLFIMEAQKALFLPITQIVKEKIEAGAIGTVNYIQSTTAYPTVHHIDWFYSVEAGGGALRGSGGYPLQYMLYVTGGEIAEAAGTAVRNPHESDTQCDVSVLFENQIQGNIFITTHLDLPSQLTFYGTKGELTIPNFWKATNATLLCEGETEKFEQPYQSEFVFEVNHVNDCLQKGLLESPIVTKELTLQTVELFEQLYQQWES